MKRILFRLNLLAVAFLVVIPSAHAVDPIRSFQIDVIGITTSLGTPLVTEENSRAIIDKVNIGLNDSTGGAIRLTFRRLYAPIVANIPVITSTDVKEVTGITPKADPGYEKAILIGVVSRNSSIDFSGFAGDEYMWINDNWTPENATTISHEIGHNIGLLHANSATCTTQLPIICTQYEYGDYSSIMGKSIYSYTAQPYVARFTATELDHLGVLPANKRAIAVDSGDYKLEPVYGSDLNLPKVLYIPIGNELAYSIEYRTAIGSDTALMQSRINSTTGNWYYDNTPSYGLQLRVLRTTGVEYQSILPQVSNYPRFDTALVSESLRGPQIQPLGKSFLLSDGSTVTFLSADVTTGATVKVARVPDTEEPKFSAVIAGWKAGSYFLGKGDERLVRRQSPTAWDYPVIEVPFAGAVDNKMIKTLELEVNGEIISSIESPLQSEVKKFSYQTNKVGSFAIRLIATDFVGKKSISNLSILETDYYYIYKSGFAVNSGPDPFTSLKISFYKVDPDYKYELTNLSSGKIESTTLNNGITTITVTGLTRNVGFTAKLTGTDELGHTDGGQDVTGTVVKTECTNTQCYVGYTWKVETGYWYLGTGNLTLQENIKGKWVAIRTAKPTVGNSPFKNNPVSFSISIKYSAAGTRTYRFVTAKTKSFSSYTGKPFTQVVTRLSS